MWSEIEGAAPTTTRSSPENEAKEYREKAMITKGNKGCAPFFALFVVTPVSRRPEKANASMNEGSCFECGDSERVL